MEPQIEKPLLYTATAKDIWDTTQKLYFKHQNVSCLCTLKNKFITASKRPLEVTSFFKKLAYLAGDRSMQRISMKQSQ